MAPTLSISSPASSWLTSSSVTLSPSSRTGNSSSATCRRPGLCCHRRGTHRTTEQRCFLHPERNQQQCFHHLEWKINFVCANSIVYSSNLWNLQSCVFFPLEFNNVFFFENFVHDYSPVVVVGPLHSTSHISGSAAAWRAEKAITGNSEALQNTDSWHGFLGSGVLAAFCALTKKEKAASDAIVESMNMKLKEKEVVSSLDKKFEELLNEKEVQRKNE